MAAGGTPGLKVPETWPLAETYWGNSSRPVHILVRNENGRDWDSLCGFGTIQHSFGHLCPYDSKLREWSLTGSTIC